MSEAQVIVTGGESRRFRARTALCLFAFGVLGTSLPGFAYNRNDVFDELSRIPQNWPENRLEVHIDGDPLDPLVAIGDPLELRATASRPARFTFVLVDPRGEVSVLAPEALTSRAESASVSTVYPPSGTGQLLQGEPAGLQTVYLVATERHVPAEHLGIAEGRDIVTLGRDPTAIAALVDVLSDETLTGRRGVERYAWLVDADVEFGTRAMRRELRMRVQQVDVLDEEARTGGARTGETGADANEAGDPPASAPLAISDVRFESGSAELTDIGRVQLDIVASELLRQEENREPLRIVLEGHTDDVGAARYNDALSRSRADAAKRYLVETGGLDADAIETAGQGESAPRVPNVDAGSRALNRRVEISVLGR